MLLIPGYWDPQAHCFIEDPEEIDELELCSLGAAPDEAARAPRKSHAGAASDAGAGTAGASGKT